MTWKLHEDLENFFLVNYKKLELCISPFSTFKRIMLNISLFQSLYSHLLWNVANVEKFTFSVCCGPIYNTSAKPREFFSREIILLVLQPFEVNLSCLCFDSSYPPPLLTDLRKTTGGGAFLARNSYQGDDLSFFGWSGGGDLTFLRI